MVMEGTPMEGLNYIEYKSDHLVAVVPRKHSLRGRNIRFATMLDFDFVALDNSTALTRLLTDQATVAGKHLRLRVQVKKLRSALQNDRGGAGHWCSSRHGREGDRRVTPPLSALGPTSNLLSAMHRTTPCQS